MKIVGRAEFLAMPPGTVYADGRKWVFGAWAIKGESLASDWFYTCLDATTICDPDWAEVYDRALETGESVEYLPCESRDGMFDDEAIFCVLEPQDVRLLIEELAKTLEAHTYFGELERTIDIQRKRIAELEKNVEGLTRDSQKANRALGQISSFVATTINKLTQPEPQDYDPNNCHCERCKPVTWGNMRFPVCPLCGNKRCPHCWDHVYACTGSNEPGQVPMVKS